LRNILEDRSLDRSFHLPQNLNSQHFHLCSTLRWIDPPICRRKEMLKLSDSELNSGRQSKEKVVYIRGLEV
jgi:hypothetical protein